MKILLVEDDKDLRELTLKFLMGERFIVDAADCYKSATQKLEQNDYDCIILDLMLPDGDGFTLLQRIRKMRGTDEGIIIASARNSVDDRVTGLELGADDFLAKPFHLDELKARINSVARRKMNDETKPITFGNVTIEPESFQTKVAGFELELTRKEYALLLYFINRHGSILSKESIAEGVWGDYVYQHQSFDFMYTQIKNVRRKLANADANIDIKAVYGFGYKLIEKD